jgi:hypothetical protein
MVLLVWCTGARSPARSPAGRGSFPSLVVVRAHGAAPTCETVAVALAGEVMTLTTDASREAAASYVALRAPRLRRARDRRNGCVRRSRLRPLLAAHCRDRGTFAAKFKRLVPTAARRSQLAHHALVIGSQRCLDVVADLEQIVRVVLLKFPSALMDSLRGVFTQVVDNSWAGFKQGHYSPRTSTGKHSHGITVGSACESLGLWRALEQRCCSLRPTMPEPQPTTTPTTQTTTASTAR